MFGIIGIIVGAIAIIALNVLLISSIVRTPTNLRGFYGVMFVALAAVGLFVGLFAIIGGIFA